MSLKVEHSILGAAGVSALVYGIYSNATPTMADMHGLPAGQPDIDRAERKATWLAAGTVSVIGLLAKDATIFVAGAAATIVMAWMTRHAVYSEGSAHASTMAPGAAQMTTANDLQTGPIAEGSTQPYDMFSGQNNEFFQ